MKKIVLVVVAFVSAAAAIAQDKNKTTSKTDLINRAGDHIMLQLSTDHWAGTLPDSIKDHTKGLSRGANIYVMMNKPFKNNPQFSAAFGVGIGSTNMYFKNINIDVKSTATKLPFTSLDSTSHFKKYKLTTAYLEIPVELRFVKDPSRMNKSLKAAIGIKVGTLLSVHTKGKTLQNKSGSTINSYTEKEYNKRFFNSTRLAATGRVGLGNYSIFGSYQITTLLKDGVGPEIHPFEIGFCLSGL
ncbi:outer membrane beta-barrel protein [Ferruginibacter sp.]